MDTHTVEVMFLLGGIAHSALVTVEANTKGMSAVGRTYVCHQAAVEKVVALHPRCRLQRTKWVD